MFHQAKLIKLSQHLAHLGSLGPLEYCEAVFQIENAQVIVSLVQGQYEALQKHLGSTEFELRSTDYEYCGEWTTYWTIEKTPT